jgi:hypothetical protein
MHVPQADYDIHAFCESIFTADQSRLFEGFHYNHVKTYLYTTEADDWLQFFEDEYQQEDYGDITKLTSSFTKRSGEMGEAVFYVAYYEDDLLMVFTAATENAIEQTVERTILESNAIVEIPIVPSDFQKMHRRVLEEHEDTNITQFKSRRIPDLADAEVVAVGREVGCPVGLQSQGALVQQALDRCIGEDRHRAGNPVHG